MEVISTLIGIILGAWVNNIFTWKIKYKVDCLKLMNENINKIRSFALEMKTLAKSYKNTSSLAQDSGYNAQIGEMKCLNNTVMDGMFDCDIKYIEDQIGNAVSSPEITNHDQDPFQVKGITDSEFGKRLDQIQSKIIAQHNTTISFRYMFCCMSKCVCNK